MTSYPELDEVLAVHRMLIERFGGSHGLWDRGALESALARPQTGYYSDLIEEAAALWESLSQESSAHRWQKARGGYSNRRISQGKRISAGVYRRWRYCVPDGSL